MDKLIACPIRGLAILIELSVMHPIVVCREFCNSKLNHRIEHGEADESDLI